MGDGLTASRVRQWSLRLVVGVLGVVLSVAPLVPAGSGWPLGPLSELLGSEPACPATIDPAAFADEQTLLAWHEIMDRHGERATASPAHTQFVDWLDRRLQRIPGMQLSELPETFMRQLEQGASLDIRLGDGTSAESLPVARAVPYSQPTPSGVRGEVLDIPTDESIADHDVAGKVVLRDWDPGAIPYPVFLAVAYYVHDTELTFDWSAEYERGWVGAQQLLDDLAAAEDGDAAGLLFVHEFPREQVEGDYVPYHGDYWQVPAIYLGSDEGARLREHLAEGPVEARMAVRASRTQADTRNLVATLPGQSDERIVITSHTDGTNAVWDNGPLAMLALAEHYAQLPPECRERTLEFVFTTGHLHLTHSGAERYAQVLDEEFDEGTVAMVLVLEHLGAREFEAVPRHDGRPGRMLQASGQSEMLANFVSESPVLVASVIEQIVAHDLQRSFVLRGADEPGVRFPPHRSYGGEGGPYRDAIIPTVAAITGSWNLFSPAFDTDEILDIELMRRQTLAYGDLVLAVDDVPREVLAGADPAYRLGRDLLGSDPLAPLEEAVPLPDIEVTAPASSSPWSCALHQLSDLNQLPPEDQR
jgi:hypothetical protein